MPHVQKLQLQALQVEPVVLGLLCCCATQNHVQVESVLAVLV